jgi:hypothetical protein
MSNATLGAPRMGDRSGTHIRVATRSRPWRGPAAGATCRAICSRSVPEQKAGELLKAKGKSKAEPERTRVARYETTWARSKSWERGDRPLGRKSRECAWRPGRG